MGGMLLHDTRRAHPEGEPIDVSVVVTTYRREQEVVEAVNSALGQRGPRLEVLVIDDSPEGSARRVLTVIADPRLTYVHRSGGGHGPADARNEGAALARGKLVSFLDDDDRLADGALAALASALSAHPDAGMAFGEVVPFGGDAESLARERAYFERATRTALAIHTRLGLARRLLFDASPIVCSACLVRRELVLGPDGFDPALPVCEDVELFLRVARAHGFVFVPVPVLHRRIGNAKLSAAGAGSDTRFREAYRLMYAKYRARHGAAELLALKVVARALG